MKNLGAREARLFVFSLSRVPLVFGVDKSTHQRSTESARTSGMRGNFSRSDLREAKTARSDFVDVGSVMTRWEHGRFFDMLSIC